MEAKTRKKRQRRLEKAFVAAAAVSLSVMLFGTLTYAAVAGGNSLAGRMGWGVEEAFPLQDARLPVQTVLTDAHIAFTAAGENGDIDYSTAAAGYVMVRCESPRPAKLIMEKDGNSLVQHLFADGEYHAYPLTMGDGHYDVRIGLHDEADRYDRMVQASFTAGIEEPFTRFLLPTWLAPFDEEKELAQTARSLYVETGGGREFADAVFEYVCGSIRYDKTLRDLPGPRLPDAGTAIATGRGICTDFASALATMLRSCGVPCQIIYGDIETDFGPRYHAWNLVWLEDETGGAWWRYDATNGVGAVKAGGLDDAYGGVQSGYGEPREIH